jgi:hypothetical protein
LVPAVPEQPDMSFALHLGFPSVAYAKT